MTRGRLWIAALCLLAGVRVFVFSAAFPFFNNVDEAAHFDLVVRYASGRIPAAAERFDPEASRLIAVYGAPDYRSRPGDFGVERFPPGPWHDPANPTLRAYVESKVRERTGWLNVENGQAPLYYVLAAGWYRLGRTLGLSDGMALYWIRFLSVPLYVALVALAYAGVRRLFPDAPWLAPGAALLLVAFPQDALYSINNDVPCALAFGGAFVMALEILRAPAKSTRFHAAAGLLAAAAVLVKLTSLAILGIVASVVVLRWRAEREDRRRLIVMAACAFVPVAAWIARNEIVLSDPTGQAGKFASLGWTLEPVSRLWHHPIFTPWGAATFTWELIASFWRGEFVWHGARLAGAGTDALYVATTLVFLAAAGTALRRRGDRAVPALSFAAIALSALPLVAISVAYDFGACVYPSRAYPYMSSGRLMIGALVPFLALYLVGLDRVLSWLHLRVDRLLATGVLAAAILAGEIVLSRDAFSSANNWFHMLGAGGP